MQVGEIPHFDSGSRAEVQALCSRVRDDLDAVVSKAVRRIRHELPEYLVVAENEHWEAVHEQLRRRLEAVRYDRPPETADLESAARLARARARQHVQISSLIDAYHIGDSEVWNALVRASDEASAPELPRLASRMMDSLHVLSSALTAAHSEVTQSLQGHRITLIHRLVERLTNGVVDDEVRAIAETLRMPATASWQVLVWAPPRSNAEVSFELQRSITGLGAQIICAARGAHLVVLADESSSTAVRTYAESHREGRWGIGMLRQGLDGAAASLEDARLALDAATAPRRVSDFSDNWVLACVAAHRDRLVPLVADLVAVAREHPHLADAVIAHWENSLSLAATAKALNMHANTLTYRLGRWRDLTGLDARSAPTLLQSWIAAQEARRP
ncbi:helix-turn-helix domain-containing protein [Streptomyces canus]|uniref:PucR family transcriptional regulator n=1 Tax=Streptomyces canus TaxID=58343 RepID=UPI002DD8DB38|nr:helix-turn-helix domain-containing protein [Streptomyces canus]WSD90521.1 helix-turn-helix domain-containing protein [Streptomyces canus]